MKDMNSSEIYRFKFNRWLARTKEDGATLRELPLISSDGKPAFPSMFSSYNIAKTIFRPNILRKT